jgi:hypothetical protein
MDNYDTFSSNDPGGGGSLTDILKGVNGLAGDATGILNALNGGNKQPTAAPNKPTGAAASGPGIGKFLPWIIGGVALLVLVVVLGRR